VKIATWNVNSLNVRLPHVLEWLQSAQPDVLVLQEIKQVTDAVATERISEAGYKTVANGQKTYNGVAVISRADADDIVTDFPGFDDPQTVFVSSICTCRTETVSVRKNTSTNLGGLVRSVPFSRTN